ncbi:complement factor H-like [Mercenaria mercenaria]|uniref:complement factor H-like n=1 Tax=Mercenaria mercenaria TaxID=6596 RepID=UPI00234E7A97|nr:complement factor H-like [Mercenaria mercenaria]
MIILEDIKKCIESCKTRKKCNFFNFENRAKLCYLIEGNSTILPEKKPGFSFGNKTEWDLTGYEACGNCSDYNVCKKGGDGKYSRCLNSGCGPPEKKSNAIVLGNMFSIGDKIQYECKKFYKPKNDVPLTSTCRENGTWTPVDECVLAECGPPEKKENAIVLGNMFLIGNQIRYECKKFYKSNKVTSTCREDGTWTQVDIVCVLEDDVYKVPEGRFYKIILGKQNWNDANKICSSIGGYLIDITSQGEQTFIEKKLGDRTCYWTGGKNMHGTYKWLDGREVNYTNWYPMEPRDRDKEYCLAIEGEIGFNYKWDDKPCDSKCCPICELN